MTIKTTAINSAVEKEIALVNEAQALLDKRKARLNEVKNKARALDRKQQLKAKTLWIADFNKQITPFFNQGYLVADLMAIIKTNANQQPVTTNSEASK